MARIYTRKTVAERFWPTVEKGVGCWLWRGAKNLEGYGMFSRGPARQAHRVAWILTHGPTVLNVLHRCDVPACVNPAHLFLGTQADNIHDMVRKRRNRPTVGEAHGNHKLTWAQVTEIRASREMSQRALAEQFGVDQSAISRIKARKRWAA